jgi:6-pyruvoyltetrahydropterin/6-carboxytetrahydropterin synthase
MISICKTFEFEAAHYLPKHEGLCKNLHGHSYRLEIEVSGEPVVNGDNPEYGMVMDFGALKSIVKEAIIKFLDHTVLNDKLEIYPTAENLVQMIADRLKVEVFPNVLYRVRLWETSTSWAEWKEE